jgi:hypothetical protein
MAIAKVYRATVSKDLAIAGSNEDSYCLRLREAMPRAAVFDGASESFAARKWSRFLSEEWGRAPSRDWSWIERAQSRYARSIANLQLTWAQEAAAERGSFSTVAYFQLDSEWLVFSAVGDSSIFLISDDSIHFSYPFIEESQFTSAPKALSSNPLDNRRNRENLLEGMGQIRYKDFNTKHVLLATDAISAWLLIDDVEERKIRLEKLMSCKTSQNFKELVVAERASRAMKIDDCTAVVVEVS